MKFIKKKEPTQSEVFFLQIQGQGTLRGQEPY
jgi:hypothetical protein